MMLGKKLLFMLKESQYEINKLLTFIIIRLVTLSINLPNVTCFGEYSP